MSIVVSDLSERLDTLTKLVLAEPVARIGHSRVTVRPLKLRGKAFFQLEYQQGQKVAHRNVARGALLETFEQELDGLFRSVTLCTETETRQYVRKTNGAYKCTAKSGAARAAVTASHNRKKEYILQEGENIPAPGVPESFKVLIKELQALCLDIKVLDRDRNVIEIPELDPEDMAPPSKNNAPEQDKQESLATLLPEDEDADAISNDFPDNDFPLNDLDSDSEDDDLSIPLSFDDDEENDDLDTMRLDDLGFDDMNLDDDDQ